MNKPELEKMNKPELELLSETKVMQTNYYFLAKKRFRKLGAQIEKYKKQKKDIPPSMAKDYLFLNFYTSELERSFKMNFYDKEGKPDISNLDKFLKMYIQYTETLFKEIGDLK